MLDRFRKFADKYGMLPEGGRVIAAVSGGADSMCLLGLLRDTAREKNLSLEAVHYNHRLRGGESDRDERFVTKWCAGHGIKLITGSGDVRAFAKSAGLGTEEAARVMRYAFFNEILEKAGGARIATAHNADDNAETVLLNLTRGAGARGLCGIPPVRGGIIRPLLCFTRAEIEGYLAVRGIPHVEDSTNSDEAYSRNRIRLSVMPVLREMNPGFARAAMRTSELLRRDDEYLRSLAESFCDSLPDKRRAAAKELSSLPYPVASRVVRRLCGAGEEPSALSAAHVDAVLSLCEKGGPSDSLSLPGICVSREYGDILFTVGEEKTSFAPVSLAAGESAVIPELGLRVVCEDGVCGDKIHKSFTTFLFNKAVVCGNIIIRPRLPGDRIALFGRSGTKTLKKLYIEEHIPEKKRGLVPVIVDEGGVLAVAGIGTDRRAAPSAGDGVLRIIFEETV